MRLQPISFGQTSFRGVFGPDRTLTLEIKQPQKDFDSYVNPAKVEMIEGPRRGKKGCTIFLDSGKSIELQNTSPSEVDGKICAALEKIGTSDTAIVNDD